MLAEVVRYLLCLVIFLVFELSPMSLLSQNLAVTLALSDSTVLQLATDSTVLQLATDTDGTMFV